MNITNEKIKDYLVEYCNLSHAPEYAILVKGKWGSGKSWFIKNVLDHLVKKEVKAMHVSLYGMANISDIEAEFFRVLHPVLSSKKMMLFSKVAKGLIKTAVNIDFNNDGKSDLSISSIIPDVNLAELSKTSENMILVFDDVERCSIPINDLLGFINQFVEHGGYKVILIANEEELISSSQNGELHKYLRIKEKLVGKTFEIESEIEDALVKFLGEYPDKRQTKKIKNSKELIQDLYIQSEYKNLRHLKQAISDFSRLVDKLSIEAQENDDLITKLLINFFIFSFEIKSGNLLANDLKGIKTASIQRLLNKSKDSSGENHSITLTKYSQFNTYEMVLNENEWIEILDKGVFDEVAIMNTLNSSIYLLDQTSPTWKRLWYSKGLDDLEVLELLSDLEKELASKLILQHQVLLHIVGIFLELKDVGVIRKSKRNIVSDAKKYIDYLKSNDHLKSSKINYDDFPHNESFDGLGFTQRDSAEFKEVTEYLKNQTQKSIIESYPQVAKSLLDKLITSTDEFCLNIHLCNSAANLYYQTPILKYMNPNDFVESFIQLPQRSKWNVGRAMRERYRFEDFNLKLLEEAAWLKIVAKLLESEARKSLPMKKSNLKESSRIFKELTTQLAGLKSE